MSAFAKERGAIGKDLRAFLGVERVGIAGFDSRVPFDDDLKARLEKIGHYQGNERNPPLSRITLLGHTNNHGVVSF